MFAVTRFRYIEALFLIKYHLDKTNLDVTQSTVQRTIFFARVIVKYEEKNLDITKPRYREHILPIPWSFVISRFFFSYFTITGEKNRSLYQLRTALNRSSLNRGSIVL